MESPFSPGLSQRPEEDWGEWGATGAGRPGFSVPPPSVTGAGGPARGPGPRPREAGGCRPPARGRRPAPRLPAPAPRAAPRRFRGPRAASAGRGGRAGRRRDGWRLPTARAEKPGAPRPSPGRSPPVCFGPFARFGGREGGSGRARSPRGCQAAASRPPGLRGTRAPAALRPATCGGAGRIPVCAVRALVLSGRGAVSAPLSERQPSFDFPRAEILSNCVSFEIYFSPRVDFL